MKLLIDAGNTRIKWGLADGQDWLRVGTLAVDQASTLPQLFADLHVQRVWVSNVAGEEVAQHIRNINIRQPVQPYFIVAQKAQCGVYNGYTDPSQLGSDRWAALIAAWHQVRGACLVVSSGTATTIDALSDKGEFIGGLILPGVELMQRSLNDATAQLKPGKGSYQAFPLNTADALFSGAIQASCGAIERQYALLNGSNIPMVLSGGASAMLQMHLQHLNLPLHVVDNLVLQGLLLIAKEADTQ